mgnify:CR=1 FL=1
MGDGWHWLWFILLLMVIDAKDDYKEEVIEQKAQITILDKQIDRLEYQLNERKYYAMKVENIAKIQEMKVEQCKNGTPEY